MKIADVETIVIQNIQPYRGGDTGSLSGSSPTKAL